MRSVTASAAHTSSVAHGADPGGKEHDGCGDDLGDESSPPSTDEGGPAEVAWP